MSHVLPNISRGRFFEPIFTSKKFDLYTSIYGKAKLKFQMTKPSQSIKKKATKFGFSVFQYKILLLNIILCVNFTREAEIVTLTQNKSQLLSLFTDFKIRYKNTKIVTFYFTDSLLWYMLM